MGCCFSKSPSQNQNPDNQNTQKNHHPHPTPILPKSNATHERAPPPPLEEETVKEVLSETPITKPHQVPILTPEPDTHLHFLQNPDGKLETNDPNPVNTPQEVPEALCQLSETCSITESFSTTTTTTITEKREEDEATSKRSIRERSSSTTTTKATTHKLNNRSPSRKHPYAVAGGRERRLKSPARRAEKSPEKRAHGGSRPVRGRDSGSAANRRLNGGPGGVRRDSGEGSGRRSRSPACSRAAGKEGGGGGGRKEVPVVKGAVVEEKEEKGVGEEVGERNDVVSQEESLENPHVSMECFIFL